MERSQSKLGHGDKSTQALSLYSMAVHPLQSPLASEVEPPPNSSYLPTVRAGDSSTQNVFLSEDGTQITTPNDLGTTVTAPNPPDSEDVPLAQCARDVPERQLPSELSGTLTQIREPPSSGTEKAGDETDDGNYAQVLKGMLKQPDGSKIEVAIKSVRRTQKVNEKRFNRRLRREALIWMSAKHPNILEFIGYKIVDGMLCLVSPWCRHGSLARYVTENRGIRDSEKLKLLHDVACGLAHIHSLKPVIAHGNIKPENVIVKNDLQAALCDFGVSRIFEGIAGVSDSTITGDMAGRTAGYQAKELLQENAPSASAPGDVYALGGLTLATLSGKNPFWKKRNAAARIAAVCMDQMPCPKDHYPLSTGDPLWVLLRECWSVDPAVRPIAETVRQKLENERKRRLVLEQDDEDYIPNPPMTSTARGASSLGASVLVGFVPPPDRGRRSAASRGRIELPCELPEPISGTLTKIGKPIGGGGHGNVYQGIWDQPGAEAKQVVIKCLTLREETRSEFIERRIKRETVIWRMATHPNVLPFFGYQIVENVPMLVSPWCSNGDLARYVGTKPELARNEKIKLLRDAACGLMYLHSLDPPIFHGDIKPQNVIVQDDLKAALCDFGISKLILASGEHSGFTTADSCSGTSGYEPKEILNEGPPTTAADVYSFGGLILATMSGKPPFWKKKCTARVVAITLDQIPSPRDHPQLSESDPLWVLLRECWSGEPSSRPSMPQVLQMLEAQMTEN